LINLEEVNQEKMQYFYHSEQSLILSIFYDAAFIEKIVGQLKYMQGTIHAFFLNIITTFDPCCRCGDALKQLAQNLPPLFLQKLQKELPKEIVLDNSLKLPFLITCNGINPYKDPDFEGSPNPLRPRKETIKAPYNEDPFSTQKHRDFLPNIACTFIP
jgi:hypothetical protein